MIDKIKKYLFSETEQILIQKELDLNKLELKLKAEYAQKNKVLEKSFYEKEEVLKSKVQKVHQLLDVYEDKIEKISKEWDRVTDFERVVKLNKQNHINHVISVRAKIESRFRELSRFDKLLKDKENELNEREKGLKIELKVVEEDKDLIETTVRGKKILVDKFGNFKKFV
jgi:hypothetical protein